jgi:hypothetical protein
MLFLLVFEHFEPNSSKQRNCLISGELTRESNRSGRGLRLVQKMGGIQLISTIGEVR